MKKFLLSIALIAGFSSIQSYNPFITNTPPGFEAYQFFQNLNLEQSNTNSTILRALILMKFCPLMSLTGAFYGASVYSVLSQLEKNAVYRSPEELNKLSPQARKVIKTLTTSTCVLLGAWLCARSYQNWAVSDAVGYIISQKA